MRVPGRPRWCRALWFIVVLFLLGFTFYMVYRLLHAYFQYSSYNKSSVTWESNVTLPAITICNINPFNYTNFKEEANGTDLVEDFETIMETLIFYNEDGDAWEEINDTIWEGFLEHEEDNGALSLRFRDWLIHTVFGYYDYEFQGNGYFIDYDDYFKFSQMTELGNCFELNDDGALKQSSGGARGGIRIDLDAKHADYLFSTPTQGFMVYIRDQDETLMLDHGGYVVSPGTEVFLKLTAESVTRLGEPHGTCENVPSRLAKYGPHYETVRECIQRQKLDVLMERCGCVPWFLADRLSTLKKTEILDEYIEKILDGMGTEAQVWGRRRREARESPSNPREDFLHRHKMNHRGMKERFRNTRSSVEDPQHEIFDIPGFNEFLDKLQKSDPEILDREKRNHNGGSTATPRPPSTSPYYKTEQYGPHICGYVEQYSCQMWLDTLIRDGNFTLDPCPEPCSYHEWQVETSSTKFPPTEEYFERFVKDRVYLYSGEPTYEYIQNNMARLHIYYDELKVANIDQTKAYEAQNFVAEFGGVVDLFIGFSFFTVLQLTEIAVAWVISKLSGGGRKIEEGGEKEGKPEREGGKDLPILTNCPGMIVQNEAAVKMNYGNNGSDSSISPQL